MGVYMLLPVIARMGATAGLAVLAVLICRGLLKRGPKLFCYLLWSVVYFRLLCPVSIPSTFSVLCLFGFGQMDVQAPSWTVMPGVVGALKSLPLPITENGGQEIKNWQDGNVFAEGAEERVDIINDMDFPDFDALFAGHFMAGSFYDLRIAWEGRLGTINHPSGKEEISGNTVAGEETGGKPNSSINQNVIAGESAAAGNQDSARAAKGVPVWLIAATWVWLVGIAGMLLYAMVSLFLLRRRLVGAVRLKGNIYQSDYIASPFVVGVFAPKIYLPSTLCGKEQEYILMHEQTHIRRGDYIFRLLAFAALVIHWFNPLVWLAFYLSGKDMEMACDEAVMRRMKEDIRAEYSASLLGLATGRHLIPGTYLAFGEGDVKSRIKNVMRYKKPTVFWMVSAAILVSGTVCAFGSDPKIQEEMAAQERTQEAGSSKETEDDTFVGQGVSGIMNPGGEGQNHLDGGTGQDETKKAKDDAGTDCEDGIGSSIPKMEKDSLTVYSLTESELVYKLIAGFTARHPEIEICYKTGEEGLSAIEQIDALTAELLAGMGPDILILDGLPAQTYQFKGLLADFGTALEPLKEELQQNILDAYTQEEMVYMLPLSYMVPVILTDEGGDAASKSLRELMLYEDVYLQGYSRADLLELLYYNYIPQFIMPDGSVDETELENFLLYTKRLGDSQNLADGECTHPYFAADLDVAAFSKTDAKIMFVPFRGEVDLRAYSDQIGEMLAGGKKLWSMDGMFFPQGLIGINAWSQKKELANQFVQAAFSCELQSEYGDVCAFPVNGRVFLQEIEGWAQEISADGNRKVQAGADREKNAVYTVDFGRLAEQMRQSLMAVHQGRMADAAVLQILQEETVGYFHGEKQLKDCVAAIMERLP